MIPTLAQYQALKLQYPHTFLFFPAKGNGYWLLHDQAWIAGQVLEVHLTGYLVLPGHGRPTVRALSTRANSLSPIMEELKRLCFGMRARVIDELPT